MQTVWLGLPSREPATVPRVPTDCDQDPQLTRRGATSEDSVRRFSGGTAGP
jgi:hypothetical protein